MFDEPDFFSTHPIEPASYVSAYRLNGAPTAEDLENAAQEYKVPPQVIATILQYENNPDRGLMGIASRAGKMTFSPIAQLVDPGHDFGSGYSQGIANIKPGTATYISAYYKLNYPGSSVTTYSSHWELGDAAFSTQLTAAYARMAIDDIYGFGYDGPMSLEGLTLVVAHHHTGTTERVEGGNYEFAPALLIDASKGNASLLYYRVPGE